MLRVFGFVLLGVVGLAAGCSSGQPTAYTGTVPSPADFKPMGGDRLKPPPPPPSLPVKP